MPRENGRKLDNVRPRGRNITNIHAKPKILHENELMKATEMSKKEVEQLIETAEKKDHKTTIPVYFSTLVKAQEKKIELTQAKRKMQTWDSLILYFCENVTIPIPE